ncbi:Crp/Fnr family transcriptional regulator [Actinomadura sp. WAC 06369]|uniref:Crp/Fnr family transcriptional regulator n=1 Tax=Actinomadura sp. WAC 06369 TaxID=2203193 RepID=UPI000F79993D|nr:cyclic nucleotide-binding domain-containing protein [Actinomadura sp. WAC 06369]RSN70976.1 hypothetical protein DMH08_04030 [Actinomadura sp. WAC 06369]
MSTVAGADLASAPFFGDMRGADLDRLASAARRVAFPAGRRFFRESDPADRFWLVLDGRAAVDLHVPGRGPVVLEAFGAGAVLGWSWLFRPHRWRFGGVAAAPTRAVEFDGRLVRTLCAVDPAMGHALARRFAELAVERLETARIRLAGTGPAVRDPCGDESPYSGTGTSARVAAMEVDRRDTR